MIHHTENDTTTIRGGSIATVIADTVSPQDGSRITTLELVYPRYIHSEFMTHRVFSRNASSSRATPLSVTLDEVMNDPVFFDYVGLNQSGMVAGGEISPEKLVEFKRDWESLGLLVASHVSVLSEKYGIHKQTLNRALEPWLRIRTLVTATDWDNFFKLRLAPDAQPEIRMLAEAMKIAMEVSRPKTLNDHFPYITESEWMEFNPHLYKISVARCARVSYARHDGKETTIREDVALHERLKTSGHMSPFEHVAFAKEGRHANFTGWQSYRNVLGE